jgi:hypothetical protein
MPIKKLLFRGLGWAKKPNVPSYPIYSLSDVISSLSDIINIIISFYIKNIAYYLIINKELCNLQLRFNIDNFLLFVRFICKVNNVEV